MLRRAFIFCAALVGGALLASSAMGQSFGVELHNTLMPAAGGMAGASIAEPQDITSGLNGNPATITQFGGTHFTFSGAWAEPTFHLTQTSNIPVVGPPLIEPFAAKSTAPGVPAGNIGVTQELDLAGLPLTMGMGFITTAGGFADFRHVPQSYGTSSASTIFNLPLVLGLDLTERLSIGGSLAMGIAFFNAPFVTIGSMTPDYALRGAVGVDYQLAAATRLGLYYQTQQSFQFDNAFLLFPGPNQRTANVQMDLPENIGFGFSNTALCDGKLLIAVDALYKMWNEADLFSAPYDNQWVLQFGGQYSLGNWRLRAGYAWAENPIDPTPGKRIGGIIQPGDLAAVRYSQGLLAITPEHRISIGVGLLEVLPGVQMDVMAGGMFRDTERLGPSTTTSVESYWIGAGLSWSFGNGGCEECECCP